MKSASSPQHQLRIAFFGHDSNESTVRKRAATFMAYGADVLGLMFHRVRKSVSTPPAWTNVDLGETTDGNFWQRSLTIMRSFAKLRGARGDLITCDIIYARNLDMLALASLAKFLLRLPAPIFYEALDVHRIFTGIGLKSRTMRAVERLLLKATSCLVVSSPAFMSQYFRPLQNYQGRWYLLENKVFLGNPATLPSTVKRVRAPGAPWIIGWFGILRCRKSLELLSEIAEDLGDKVVIHIRGTASEPDGITDEGLRARCAKTSNMHFFGAYDNARDLAAIYGAVDIGWAVDFSAQGANSDWLIPNRIYESGLYGVPVIARKNTTTGELVDELAMGWCFTEPFADNVAAFLSALGAAEYGEMIERLRNMPPKSFVDITDTTDLLDCMQEVIEAAGRDRKPRTAVGAC